MKSVLSELSHGRSVQLKSKGNSMAPLYKDGEVILISPIVNELKVGDVVLARLSSKKLFPKNNQDFKKFVTHQILDIKDGRYTIANLAGKIDDIVDYNAIYGIVSKTYPNFSGLTFIE